jgi:hypothetical protein
MTTAPAGRRCPATSRACARRRHAARTGGCRRSVSRTTAWRAPSPRVNAASAGRARRPLEHPRERDGGRLLRRGEDDEQLVGDLRARAPRVRGADDVGAGGVVRTAALDLGGDEPRQQRVAAVEDPPAERPHDFRRPRPAPAAADCPASTACAAARPPSPPTRRSSSVLSTSRTKISSTSARMRGSERKGRTAPRAARGPAGGVPRRRPPPTGARRAGRSRAGRLPARASGGPARSSAGASAGATTTTTGRAVARAS